MNDRAPANLERYPWPAAFNVAPKWAVEREDVYELEMERIFEGAVWHVVGHVAELDRPGCFKTAMLGRTPLILVHGEDGRVRALHNSCAHRGTLVEPRFRGEATGFECPYHRWAYGLGGELVRCPGENNFPESFRREHYGLARARAETFRGVIFVTLSEHTPPLEQWVAGIEAPLRAAVGGDGRLVLLGYQKVVFDANWKVYIDDEGYHAPLLHKAFQLLQWKGGQGRQTRTENGHRITETIMEGIQGEPPLLEDPELVRYKGGSGPRNKMAHQKAGSLLVTPWPLGAVMNHLDIINMRIANPLNIRQTEVHYTYFAHQDDDDEMVRHRVRQASNLIGPSGFISLEDGAVFRRIQRAIHTQPAHTHYVHGWREDGSKDPYDVTQNDETTNTVWWEMYRRTMGFRRAGPSNVA
ncbi:MAG: aromatic ring-hydroxylating dioxygenase subunit alpha [Gammaproteobacteria bacterium]|nr:aromatic ring-hydroxylating dioxygenase subunit alpha [Gammaproteobacteria bacterium]NIR84912.1 aromatic ring-hydroxylating dioxygenase subunit alpha [Gammaproteobacteria bacterium]NIR91761.1 aromatic ring-hydroxylating dioxygenase subunit alpha [Gammaproteobacteria bacterium]NIU05959.1 aromatic ring-hydroxylating dioxygenase subunit alpha [Gammaproteobacteria bacterium]NIV53006.1 Rieske 2Fe-2S domain-containing protein [Gammaproteobacteria bacterium]